MILKLYFWKDWNSKKLLAVAGILLALYTIYSFAYIDRVWPRVYLGSSKLSGMRFGDAKRSVDSALYDYSQKPVTFKIGDRTVATSLTDLGVILDSGETYKELKVMGREGKAPDFGARVSYIFKRTMLKPSYSIDFSKFSHELDRLFSVVETRAQDANIEFSDSGVRIAKEVPGNVVDRATLAASLKRNLASLDSGEIELIMIAEQPRVTEAQSGQALQKVKSLSGQNIVLVYGYDSWSLGGNNLLSVLKFFPSDLDGGYFARIDFFEDPIVVEDVLAPASQDRHLKVSLDEEKINAFIDQITKAVDRQAVDATLKFEGGKVSEFTAAVDGQKLDFAKTKGLISERVSVNKASSETRVVINLPVAVTPAKIASQEINSLGIRELVGRGVSYFAGSIANRAYNVGLGVSKLSGTLVKPGETFSFNNTVGEVSGKTGYRQAYVISEGRTVLDDGGGICQVSTTVFRAALDAGLPIVARTAHAYRVGYYEQHGFRPGFDATVWAPAVDLQFKNDTDHHLLVQAVVDPANAKLEVDIYGTLDGRRVVMTDPVISNQQPAPPDKYQDDPTLPRGTTKQVDFAAAGATSVFTRKVYKRDKLIIDDVFRSNFRPWQAIYLVGTGT